MATYGGAGGPGADNTGSRCEDVDDGTIVRVGSNGVCDGASSNSGHSSGTGGGGAASVGGTVTSGNL